MSHYRVRIVEAKVVGIGLGRPAVAEEGMVVAVAAGRVNHIGS